MADRVQDAPFSVVFEHARLAVVDHSGRQASWIVRDLNATMPWDRSGRPNTVDLQGTFEQGQNQFHFVLTSLLTNGHALVSANNTRLSVSGRFHDWPVTLAMQGELTHDVQTAHTKLNDAVIHLEGLPIHLTSEFDHFFKNMQINLALLPIDLGRALNDLGVKPEHESAPLHDVSMTLDWGALGEGKLDLQLEKEQIQGVFSKGQLKLHLHHWDAMAMMPWLIAIEQHGADGKVTKQPQRTIASFSSESFKKQIKGLSPNVIVSIDQLNTHFGLWQNYVAHLSVTPLSVMGLMFKTDAYGGKVSGHFAFPFSRQASGGIVLKGNHLDALVVAHKLHLPLRAHGIFSADLALGFARPTLGALTYPFTVQHAAIHVDEGALDGLDPLAWFYGQSALQLQRDWLHHQGHLLFDRLDASWHEQNHSLALDSLDISSSRYRAHASGHWDVQDHRLLGALQVKDYRRSLKSTVDVTGDLNHLHWSWHIEK